MTAEIAILTRSGVALAADSALTVGKERVWKHANKLFSLSPRNDIAVMIYGTGDFCGVPWDLVINEFRRSVSGSSFKTVSDCAEFLGSFRTPEKSIDVLNTLIIFANAIDDCSEALTATGKLERRRQFQSIAHDLAQQAHDREIILDSMTPLAFNRLYSQTIEDIAQNGCDVRITRDLKSSLITLCYERLRRQFTSTFETGVVVAGYGEEELFPSLRELIVDGRHRNSARVWTMREYRLSKKKSPSAIVIPFAQTDIAYLFMEGIQSDYIDFIGRIMEGTLNVKSEDLVRRYVPDHDKVVETEMQRRDNATIVQVFLDKFKEYRQKDTISQMLTVVSSLPKEEMAAMAEALVEITSLRRKIDSKLESVGGPVDVAVISKSDGFVWLKRKHYFDKAINTDFLERRRRRYGKP